MSVSALTVTAEQPDIRKSIQCSECLKLDVTRRVPISMQRISCLASLHKETTNAGGYADANALAF